MTFSSNWALIRNGQYRDKFTSEIGFGVSFVPNSGLEVLMMLTQTPPVLKHEGRIYGKCLVGRSDCTVYREVEIIDVNEVAHGVQF